MMIKINLKHSIQPIIVGLVMMLNLGFCLTSIAADSAAASDAKTKVSGIVFTDPLKPIVVKKSQAMFAIILQSNPTTGYSWALKGYDNNLIKPISRNFYPATKTGLVGAPGYEKWIFAVKPAGFVVPQTTSITLIYSRPWDLEGSQATNFKVVTTNDG